MSTDYVSQWPEKLEAEPLSRKSLLAMLDGKIPCIRVPGFVSREVAKKIEDSFSSKVSPYVNVPGPTLNRVGVAQFEFQAFTEAEAKARPADAKDRYFEVAKQSYNLHKKIEEICGVDIWQEVFTKLKETLSDFDVNVASEGPDKKYFSGIMRSINDSTPIHCDWSPYDNRTENWIINRVLNQGVFNLYLTPFKGGRTEVHDVQWTPEAMKFRDPESYGYYEGLVEGRAKVALTPGVGDLYFFNARNMHQVFPVEQEENPEPGLVDGRRQRLTISSFFGMLPQAEGEKPKVVMWS